MPRIIGIDPGSRITGYGVIDCVGQRVAHVASGCIAVKGDDLAARLKVIFERVGEVLDEHRPDELAAEQVFMSRNASSALKLGQARGAAILAGATRDLPVAEYAPNQIKLAVTGQGHASKEQMQHMVRVLLGLARAPAADAADALAVALCHGHLRETAQRIRAAEARAAAR